MNVHGPSVLVVEDEAYVRRSLVTLLESVGWVVAESPGVQEALGRLSERDFEVVLCDLRLADGQAFDLLSALDERGCGTPLIIVSGAGTLADAVRGLKSGAFDYIQKPIDPDELSVQLSRAAEYRRLEREVGTLRDSLERVRGPRTLIGDSAAMRALRERVGRAAAARAPVLIRGESGSGKDVVAEELHRLSPQASRPLWRLHAGCLAARSLHDALEPWLAACRSARAGGMVILEGLALLPLEAQLSLLRLLDAIELDHRPGTPLAGLRVVATSSDDLESAVQSGALRSDLYWRMNGFGVAVPALREHREDLPQLVAHFLAHFGSLDGEEGGAAGRPSVSGEAMALLESYEWPGNVRELRNVLERALIVAGGRDLDAELFGEILESGLSTRERAPSATLHLRTRLNEAERAIVQEALEQAGDSRKKAAFLLGIDPRNLSYYVRKHRLHG